jgi:hypothetical protein
MRRQKTYTVKFKLTPDELDELKRISAFYSAFYADADEEFILTDDQHVWVYAFKAWARQLEEDRAAIAWRDAAAAAQPAAPAPAQPAQPDEPTITDDETVNRLYDLLEALEANEVFWLSDYWFVVKDLEKAWDDLVDERMSHDVDAHIENLAHHWSTASSAEQQEYADLHIALVEALVSMRDDIAEGDRIDRELYGLQMLEKEAKTYVFDWEKDDDQGDDDGQPTPSGAGDGDDGDDGQPGTAAGMPEALSGDDDEPPAPVVDQQSRVRDVTAVELFALVVEWDQKQVIPLGEKIGYQLTEECVASVCERLKCTRRDFWTCVFYNSRTASRPYAFFKRDHSAYQCPTISRNPAYNRLYDNGQAERGVQ